MPSLKHAAPATIAGACSLLADYGEEAAILSGGQSLLPTVRHHESSYDIVVDINNLEEQAYIKRDAGQLCIGCLTRHADVAESELVNATIPALSDAAASIGDVQVRNRGTLCGAVAQADRAGDPPTIVTLFDADIVATSVDSERVIDGQSFFQPSVGTALEQGELIRELRFDIPGEDTGSGYAKWTPAEGSYPIAAVGALLGLDGETVSTARLVAGVQRTAPTEMSEAAATLLDDAPTDDRLSEAARTLGANSDPIDDFEGSMEFKRELTTTMARDALDIARERARD